METIAWDVDDVLNDLMREWFSVEWKSKHPRCEVAFDEISENPPHGILKVTKEEYLESLDSFRASEGYSRLAPVEPVLKWFVTNGHEYRHIAVTRVPVRFAPQSSEWVLRHFGKWIRTFHFVPSPRNTIAIPEYDVNKKDFLQWIQKVDYLVDDNEENIDAIESIGVKGILFPRPWNSENRKSIKTFLTNLTLPQ
jgi:hypothetical protein